MSQAIPPSDPKVEINSERFISLSKVFEQEDFDIRELRAIMNIEDILNPGGRYNRLTPYEAIEEIRDERAELSFKMIDTQNALAKAGMARVGVICQCFNHYAAKAENVTAVESDLYHQDMDISIMATLSDSQLKFSHIYAKDQPTRLAAYSAKVDEQFDTLRKFRAGGLASIENVMALKASVTKDWAVERPTLAALSESTTEVMRLNFALASQIGDVVKAQLRGLYYWREFLKHQRYDAAMVDAHKDEMARENGLSNVYIQRRDILSTRGTQLGQLADMVLKA